MHELSIAQSLVRLVEEQLPPGARVLRLTVRVGEASGVVPAALRSAFPAAAAGTIADGAALVIQPVRVAAWCETCGVEREVPGPFRLVCGTCGSHMPRLLRGRELELVSIEVTDAGVERSSVRPGEPADHKAGGGPPEGVEAE